MQTNKSTPTWLVPRAPGKSALSVMNVRLLINKLKKDLGSVLENYIVDPSKNYNDDVTRDMITNDFQSYMHNLKLNQAIYDFKVICDKSNNSPSVVNNGELKVDILLQPIKSVSFIQINMNVTSGAGVDLELDPYADMDQNQKLIELLNKLFPDERWTPTLTS